MTIEDPIEFLHGHKKCLVNQRELGSDAQSFGDALKAALRQDPDVILVGEMRDLETISTALTAAETGHLVFATLHTQDTAQTIDRIIDVFPAHQQGQVRVQLSVALQGIMTQQLLPNADGSGRVVATRGARADPRRAQPDPRGQDPPDLLRPADRLGAGHADDGRLPRRPRAPGQDRPEARRSALDHPRGAPAPARRAVAGGRIGRRAMSTYVFKAIDLTGAKSRGEVEAESKQAVADQLKQRGLVVLDITDKRGSQRDRARVPQARQGQRPRGLLAPALDDDLLRDEHPAGAVRARGADREQVPQRNDRRGAQGRRGGPLAQRLDGAPPEGLQPAVRRDDAGGGDGRCARGRADARRRPAPEGRRPAPPDQIGDGLPGDGRRSSPSA